jgi:hypothetical protein
MPWYEVDSDGFPTIPVTPFEVVDNNGTLGLSVNALLWKDNGVAVAPDPPTILSSSNMPTATTAVLNFTAPTGAVIRGYEVFRDGVFVTRISKTAVTYTFTGVPNDSQPHVFSIRTVGQRQTSAFANITLQFASTPVSPPSAPANLTVSNVTTTGASLSWTEQAVAPGDPAIASHNVRYAGGILLKSGIQAAARSTNLTNLTENTPYNGVYATRLDVDGRESNPSNTRSFTTLSSTSNLRTVAGQITNPHRVIMGMATDNYAARVAEVGKNGADHSFVGSWNVAGMISDIQTAHSRGVFPLVSMKVNPNTWAEVANGALDSGAANLANQINNLGYPCRISFHHEPAGSGGASSAGDNGTLGEWRDMLIRLFGIIKPIASNAVLGPIDNGYKWSAKAQGWSDAELATVYTPALLNVCDTLGSDCYDGSKQSTPQVWGEPAYVKAQRMLAWAVRIGWDGPLDIGEWNFIRPQDATAMWNVFSANPERWWLATVFNSDNNNRADIPNPPGHWNFTHDYATANDRLNAYKAAVNDPIAYP